MQAVVAESLLLTTNEVEELLRTSRPAVYAMVERGQIPGVIRIGRRILVRNRRSRARYCTDRCCTRGRREGHCRKVAVLLNTIAEALDARRRELQFPVDAVDSVGRPIRDRSEQGQ